MVWLIGGNFSLFKFAEDVTKMICLAIINKILQNGAPYTLEKIPGLRAHLIVFRHLGFSLHQRHRSDCIAAREVNLVIAMITNHENEKAFECWINCR